MRGPRLSVMGSTVSGCVLIDGSHRLSCSVKTFQILSFKVFCFRCYIFQSDVLKCPSVSMCNHCCLIMRLPDLPNVKLIQIKNTFIMDKELCPSCVLVCQWASVLNVFPNQLTWLMPCWQVQHLNFPGERDIFLGGIFLTLPNHFCEDEKNL